MISLWIVTRRVELTNRDIRTSSRRETPTRSASPSSDVALPIPPPRPASPTPSLQYPPSYSSNSSRASTPADFEDAPSDSSTVDPEWRQVPDIEVLVEDPWTEAESSTAVDTEDYSDAPSTPERPVEYNPRFLRAPSPDRLENAPIFETLALLAAQPFPFVDEDFFVSDEEDQLDD